MWRLLEKDSIKKIQELENNIDKPFICDVAFIFGYSNFFEQKNCWYKLNPLKKSISYYIHVENDDFVGGIATFICAKEDLIENITDAFEFHNKKFSKEAFLLDNITEEEKLFLQKRNKLSFNLYDHSLDNYLYKHYIYEKNLLIKFPGSKMQKKRNHYNYFLNNFLQNTQVLELSKDNIEKAKVFVKEWKEKYQNIAESRNPTSYFHFLDEINYTFNFLQYFEYLNAKGYLFIVNDKVSGLTIIRKINKHMSVLICNKCYDDTIRGLFQFAISYTVENGAGNAKYIDFQDDANDEGLRSSKHSYNPVLMIERNELKIWK